MIQYCMSLPTLKQTALECQCSMRTKLVGDGCYICNPEYAAQFPPKPAVKAKARRIVTRRCRT